ncbi:hypothetical protein JYT31_00530 [Beggiatoa alba]|nr:hypothetical protein [Beggiatoa alba]
MFKLNINTEILELLSSKYQFLNNRPSQHSVKSVYHTSSARLLLSVLFLLVTSLAFTHTLDTSSKQQIDKAFNHALITFGISKALKGVVSVIQNSEIVRAPDEPLLSYNIALTLSISFNLFGLILLTR